MTPATQPDESASRLERIVALLDDLDRLKGNPEARQVAMERMQKELDAAQTSEPRGATH